MLYGQEVPLPFDHALANPSDGTTQPATASSSTNIAQNATAQSYTTNAPELAKTIQNYIQNAKKKFKKHSNTKKLIMIQNTNQFNFK